jgi:hypothetical protein
MRRNQATAPSTPIRAIKKIPTQANNNSGTAHIQCLSEFQSASAEDPIMRTGRMATIMGRCLERISAASYSELSPEMLAADRYLYT